MRCDPSLASSREWTTKPVIPQICDTVVLTAENAKLSAENIRIKASAKPIVPTNVAGGDAQYTFKIEYRTRTGHVVRESISKSWGDIFDHIGFKVQIPASYVFAKKYLQDALSEEHAWKSCSIPDKAFETIGVQLKALGLIDIYVAKSTEGQSKIWWKSTIHGLNYISGRRIQEK